MTVSQDAIRQAETQESYARDLLRRKNVSASEHITQIALYMSECDLSYDKAVKEYNAGQKQFKDPVFHPNKEQKQLILKEAEEQSKDWIEV